MSRRLTTTLTIHPGIEAKATHSKLLRARQALSLAAFCVQDVLRRYNGYEDKDLKFCFNTLLAWRQAINHELESNSNE